MLLSYFTSRTMLVYSISIKFPQQIYNAIISILILRWGNWAPKRSSNSLSVLELAKWQSQNCSQVCHSNKYNTVRLFHPSSKHVILIAYSPFPPTHAGFLLKIIQM